MHTIFTESLPIINSNLFITKDALRNHLLLMNSYSQMSAETPIPPYKDITQKTLHALQQQTPITLTMEYSDSTLDNAIAFHRINGTIYYDFCRWFFSTKTFMREVQEAENNPGILGHLIVVASGGGESYSIQKAVDILADCEKPVIVLTESVMASAALYLCLPADKIYCSTNFDIVGSIGTMVAYWDMAPYLKQLGMKFVEAYATESTHKNKKYDDLEKGEKNEFIKTVLDPLQAAFRSSVEKYRPDTLQAPEESHVFNGETWFAQEAIKFGLIDGFNKNFSECATEVYDLGIKHKERISTTQKLYTLIND